MLYSKTNAFQTLKQIVIPIYKSKLTIRTHFLTLSVPNQQFVRQSFYHIPSNELLHKTTIRSLSVGLLLLMSNEASLRSTLIMHLRRLFIDRVI